MGHELSLARERFRCLPADYLRGSGQAVSRDGHRIRERLFNVAKRHAIMSRRRIAMIARVANSLSGLPRIDVINPLPPTERRVIAVRNLLSREIVMELHTLIDLNLHLAVSYDGLLLRRMTINQTWFYVSLLYSLRWNLLHSPSSTNIWHMR